MEKKGLNIWHGLLATLISILFLLFGGIIMIPIFGKMGSLYACIPIALIAAGFTCFTKTKFKEVFPFALPPIKVFFGSLILSFGVRMFSTAVSVGVGMIFDSTSRSSSINSLLLKMSPFTAILVLAVFPAVCEEFFCRGFLVRCFFRIKNEKLIIILTAVIFGVMHLDPYSFFYTAIFGALLCFIALRTKSLLIPIFLHFSSNALSVATIFLFKDTLTSETVQQNVNVEQSISQIIIYLALSAVPLFIGYRMFTGKKVWGNALLITFVLSVAIMICGYFLMLKSMFVTVDRDAEVIKYEDCINEHIKLGIDNDGYYAVSATFTCTDKIEVYLMCGDEELLKRIGAGSVIINHSIERKSDDGEYYIIIKSVDETLLSDTLSYSYKIEKVNMQ